MDILVTLLNFYKVGVTLFVDHSFSEQEYFYYSNSLTYIIDM